MRYKLGGGRASYSRVADLKIAIRLASSFLGDAIPDLSYMTLDELKEMNRGLMTRLREAGLIKGK